MQRLKNERQTASGRILQFSACSLQRFSTHNPQNSKLKSQDPPALTAFSDQPYTLRCAGYECTDKGVKSANGKTVCLHPILPAGSVTDVETGAVSLIVAFRTQSCWEEKVYPRTLLANASSILALAGAGIAVTSENARALSTYLTTLFHLNDDLLPQKYSMNRLGWATPYADTFAPFSEEILTDAEGAFLEKRNAVRPCGDEQTWLAAVKPLWLKNRTARLVLDAAFGSILLTPLDLQPFFVHIWGQTGLGKTVLLQLAASVWGDPAPGKLITTFHSTATGLELNAAFLHDLPMLIDELQIVSAGGKNDFQQTVYALAEGVGKTRGNKDGGLRKMSTWKNIMITTGERPLGTDLSGGGALNRALELELTEPVTDDFAGLVNTVSVHHGSAGYRFWQAVTKRRNILKQMWLENTAELLTHGATGKQATAMAVLMLADSLLAMTLFAENGQPADMLSAQVLAPLLLSNAQVNTEQKGLDYLFETIAANPAHFPDTVDEKRPVEIWGRHGGVWTAVIGSVYNRIMEEGGFSPRAVLAYADRMGLLMKDGKNYKKTVTINKSVVRCVVIKRPVKP